jgi:hemolysin III
VALRALDHANIYVLIAATITPFCVNVLSGWFRPLVLGLIWPLAAAGAALSVPALRLPRFGRVALYLVMGWIGVLPAVGLFGLLPPEAMLLLVAGGALYSLGAIIYARRRPDPFPRVFGFHELFHLFAIAGCAVFFAVIWVWVIPHPRP